MNTKSKIIQSIKIWVVIYPSITLFHMLFGSTFIVLQNADLNIGISTLDGICGIAIGTSFTENHR